MLVSLRVDDEHIRRLFLSTRYLQRSLQTRNILDLEAYWCWYVKVRQKSGNMTNDAISTLKGMSHAKVNHTATALSVVVASSDLMNRRCTSVMP
jgi:hypothetical protein